MALLAILSSYATACGGSSSATPPCGGTCDSNAACEETLTPPACVCHVGYTGTGKVCTLVTCPQLTVTDGSVIPAGNGTYQGTVTYSCLTGYRLSSSDATRTCQADGTWSGTAPTCAKVTCPALTVANGSVTPAGIGTYQGTVTYGCDTGYALSATDTTRTCQADGTWSGTAPSCVAIPTACDADPCVHGPCTPTSNSYVCGPCDAGYTGTNCDQLVTCGPLGDPDHGRVTPSTTTVGSSVTYGCNTGYALTGNGGSSTRTCLASGNFDGTAPTCSPLDCGTPPGVANAGAPVASGGAGGGSTTTYGATAAYTCKTGYTESGADPTCGATGTWSTAPTCVASVCGTFTDVVYRVVGTFQITKTPMGLRDQTFPGLGSNGSTPEFTGAGDTTPFSVPPPVGGTSFTNGLIRLRFTNDSAGNPQAGTVWLVEWYFPSEFNQTTGANITVNFDHSVGILAPGLSNCGGGDAACTNHKPALARTCATNATGTLAGTSLSWGPCTPAPTGQTSWNYSSARAAAGAGCAAGYNAWGNATCNSSCTFVPTAELGDSYQTWNQQLQPFTLSSTDYKTASITMPAMQIPNGSGDESTLLSITSSSVLTSQCGSSPGTDLVCNVQ